MYLLEHLILIFANQAVTPKFLYTSFVHLPFLSAYFAAVVVVVVLTFL